MKLPPEYTPGLGFELHAFGSFQISHWGIGGPSLAW
jgi:hypothetical protein